MDGNQTEPNSGAAPRGWGAGRLLALPLCAVLGLGVALRLDEAEGGALNEACPTAVTGGTPSPPALTRLAPSPGALRAELRALAARAPGTVRLRDLQPADLQRVRAARDLLEAGEPDAAVRRGAAGVLVAHVARPGAPPGELVELVEALACFPPPAGREVADALVEADLHGRLALGLPCLQAALRAQRAHPARASVFAELVPRTFRDLRPPYRGRTESASGRPPPGSAAPDE